MMSSNSPLMRIQVRKSYVTGKIIYSFIYFFLKNNIFISEVFASKKCCTAICDALKKLGIPRKLCKWPCKLAPIKDEKLCHWADKHVCQKVIHKSCFKVCDAALKKCKQVDQKIRNWNDSQKIIAYQCLRNPSCVKDQSISLNKTLSKANQI